MVQDPWMQSKRFGNRSNFGQRRIEIDLHDSMRYWTACDRALSRISAITLDLKLDAAFCFFGDGCIDSFQLLFFFGLAKLISCQCLIAPVLRISKSLGALEDRGHRVVICLADRIELVVMASRATQGQAHEGFAQRIDLLIDRVHGKFFTIRFRQNLRTQNQKAGRRVGFKRMIRQQIAGDLFHHKAIKMVCPD